MSQMMEPTGAADDGRQPPSLSPPSDDRAGKGSASQAGPSRSGGKPRVPSEDECLLALGRLPALNLHGMIDIRQANAFRGIYATILQHHQRQHAAHPAATLEHPGLIDLLRQRPELASELEPLLGDEQIARLMAEARDENPPGE